MASVISKTVLSARIFGRVMKYRTNRGVFIAAVLQDQRGHGKEVGEIRNRRPLPELTGVDNTGVPKSVVKPS